MKDDIPRERESLGIPLGCRGPLIVLRFVACGALVLGNPLAIPLCGVSWHNSNACSLRSLTIVLQAVQPLLYCTRS